MVVVVVVVVEEERARANGGVTQHWTGSESGVGACKRRATAAGPHHGINKQRARPGT